MTKGKTNTTVLQVNKHHKKRKTAKYDKANVDTQVYFYNKECKQI